MSSSGPPPSHPYGNMPPSHDAAAAAAASSVYWGPQMYPQQQQQQPPQSDWYPSYPPPSMGLPPPGVRHPYGGLKLPPGAPPPPLPPAMTQGLWACSYCSVMNPGTAGTCRTCSSQRGGGLPPLPGGLSSSSLAAPPPPPPPLPKTQAEKPQAPPLPAQPQRNTQTIQPGQAQAPLNPPPPTPPSSSSHTSSSWPQQPPPQAWRGRGGPLRGGPMRGGRGGPPMTPPRHPSYFNSQQHHQPPYGEDPQRGGGVPQNPNFEALGPRGGGQLRGRFSSRGHLGGRMPHPSQPIGPDSQGRASFSRGPMGSTAMPGGPPPPVRPGSHPNPSQADSYPRGPMGSTTMPSGPPPVRPGNPSSGASYSRGPTEASSMPSGPPPVGPGSHQNPSSGASYSGESMGASPMPSGPPPVGPESHPNPSQASFNQGQMGNASSVLDHPSAPGGIPERPQAPSKGVQAFSGAPYSEGPKSVQPPPTPKAPEPQTTEPSKTPSQNEVISKEDDLLKQEQKFDKVFSAWEQNFEKWKVDNMDNPDKEYVKSQRIKMEEMRSQMLQRRHNIRSQRSRLIEMKRKWSEEDSKKVDSKTDEKQEPEVKKSMLHECVDMDIDTDDPEGGRDDAASKEEEARSMPWDNHALSSNTGGIPGLGDGKDSEKKATEQKLVDLSSKDLENISKAVLSLTSKKSEESPPIADDVPTSKEPILPPNEEHPPENAGWGNKPWRPESSANQGDTLRASLFSRRNNMDSDERGIIAPWGAPKARPPPAIDPWKTANDGGNIHQGDFPERRREDFFGHSRGFTHRHEEGYANRGRGGFFGRPPRFQRGNNNNTHNRGFRSGSNVEVIDYGHQQKHSGPSEPVVNFKAYGPSRAYNTHPPPFSKNVQDKPLEFMNQSEPRFFTSEPEAVVDTKPEEITIDIDELIQPPGRYTRPPKIMIIFRGLPGSGKTHTVKAIKSLEAELGSETPRILALDDYFECDGKYEYDAALEESYRGSLLKSLKKQIDDGYFNFIMVESINNKTQHYSKMADYGLGNGFEVYIAELEAGLSVCTERNVHGRTQKELEALIQDWEDTPLEYKRIDLKSLEESSKKQSEDEDEVDKEANKKEKADSRSYKSDVKKEEMVASSSKSHGNSDEEDSQDNTGTFSLSKWEIMDNDPSNARLNDLDGLSEKAKKKYKAHRSIEDWLDLDGYKQPGKDSSGKKMVRWADIEEKMKLEKMRDVGFVVGQTNWNRMMNHPTAEESALTQTKIIPNRFQNF